MCPAGWDQSGEALGPAPCPGDTLPAASSSRSFAAGPSANALSPSSPARGGGHWEVEPSHEECPAQKALRVSLQRDPHAGGKRFHHEPSRRAGFEQDLLIFRHSNAQDTYGFVPATKPARPPCLLPILVTGAPPLLVGLSPFPLPLPAPSCAYKHIPTPWPLLPCSL